MNGIINFARILLWCFIADSVVSHQCDEIGNFQGSNPHKFCCRNSLSLWVEGEKPMACCPHAEEPVYNANNFMCNGTKVIPRMPQYEQCEINRICIKKSNQKKRSILDPPTPEECEGDLSCCEGQLLNVTSHLCNRELNKRVRKIHSEDDTICGNKTYKRGSKQYCENQQLKINSSPNVAKCDNEIILHAIDCCGNQPIYKGEICCGGEYYPKKPGYKCCDDERYLNAFWCRRKPVEPLHPYYFGVTTSQEITAKDCTYTGRLWIPSRKDDKDQPMINENFEVIAKCNAMKDGAWYIIQYPGKMLTTKKQQIRIRKRQFINRLRSRPAKHVNKFYENRPYDIE